MTLWGRSRLQRIGGGLLFAAGCAYATGVPDQALPAIKLGSASRFAVLAGKSIFNSDESQIFGDLGVSHGGHLFGFPPAKIYSGTIRLDDFMVKRAGADAADVFKQLWNLPSFPVKSNLGMNLEGLKLRPGIYAIGSSARLNGTLWLDAQGKNHAVFVFQIGDNLSTEPNSKVLLANGSAGDQIYWAVGGSTTLGKGTAFRGNILARARVDIGLGATIYCGRAFSLDAGVTMDGNAVSIDCRQTKAGASLPPVVSAYRGIPFANRLVASPEPGSFYLGCAGLAAVGAIWLVRILWSR